MFDASPSVPFDVGPACSSPKNAATFSASRVALLTITRNSGRFFLIFFSSPSRTSELSDRSCASSTMITEYLDKRGSTSASLSSIPSVKNLIFVFAEVASSNLIEYPT